jgi:hypothetical protein
MNGKAMKSWIIWAVRSAAAAVMFITGAVFLILVLFKFNGAVAAMSVLFLFGGAFSFPKIPNAWRREPPSQKQLAYAAKLGIDVPTDISKGELSDMISSVVGR